MDKKHAEGLVDKAKGRLKEAAGALTGNRKMQAEGRGDQTKGSLKDKVGNLKEAFRKDFDPKKKK